MTSHGAVPRVAAATAAAVGTAALVGWAFDLPLLTSIVPGLSSMKVNTAAAFILAGASLWFSDAPSPAGVWIGTACALAVGAIGLLTVSEYLLRWDLGIDQLLFHDPAAAVATPYPGRMGLNTGLNFTLLSVPLLIRDRGAVRSRWWADGSTAAAAVIALTAAIGYVYSATALTGLASYTQMAIQTVTLFVVLCVGLFARHRDGPLMSIVLSKGPGGLIVRRILPVMLGVLLAFGWLRVQGQEVGLYGTQFGTSIFVLASLVSLGAVTLWSAARLDRGDAERRRLMGVGETRFRAAVESAPNGMVMIDRSGRIVLVNREIERMFGYSKADLLGRAIDLLVPTGPREGHPGLRAGFFDHPRTRPMGGGRDLNGARKDGVEIPVEIGLNPIEMDDGLFVLASVVDITERRRAEQQLRETSERYHRTLDNMLEGCQILSPEWRYVYVNDAAARHGRTTRELLLGRTMREVYPGIEVTEMFAALRRCVDERVPISMENEFRYLDGTAAWFELRLQPVPEGVFILSIDITDRKRAEADLRRSNEELERFAYVASHDLQEPLRMVGSYVQLLARRYKGKLDADADDFIGFAVQGATRMQLLIEDLLAFSRVGTRGAAFVSTPARAALDHALARLKLAIDEAGATITCDDLPSVRADPGQLEQLFANLIANALKFHGREPPRVRVAARRDGLEWVFSVNDNGIGIDPRQFDRIFIMFQRLHGRDEYPGTGIGLAVCKKIVERHGGRIWVESQPGQGSTFYFALPAAGDSA